MWQNTSDKLTEQGLYHGVFVTSQNKVLRCFHHTQEREEAGEVDSGGGGSKNPNLCDIIYE